MSKRISLTGLAGFLMVLLLAQGCVKSSTSKMGMEDEASKAGTRVVPMANRDMKVREEEGLKDVNFDFDKSAIRSDAKEVLKYNAEWMMNNSDAKVLVEGHCDERGTSEYNLALGERRALAVKAYLVRLGVEAERVYTISYGEELPIDAAHNIAAWAKNRRAHMAVTIK